MTDHAISRLIEVTVPCQYVYAAGYGPTCEEDVPATVEYTYPHPQAGDDPGNGDGWVCFGLGECRHGHLCTEAQEHDMEQRAIHAAQEERDQ